MLGSKLVHLVPRWPGPGFWWETRLALEYITRNYKSLSLKCTIFIINGLQTFMGSVSRLWQWCHWSNKHSGFERKTFRSIPAWTLNLLIGHILQLSITNATPYTPWNSYDCNILSTNSLAVLNHSQVHLSLNHDIVLPVFPHLSSSALTMEALSGSICFCVFQSPSFNLILATSGYHGNIVFSFILVMLDKRPVENSTFVLIFVISQYRYKQLTSKNSFKTSHILTHRWDTSTRLFKPNSGACPALS